MPPRVPRRAAAARSATPRYTFVGAHRSLAEWFWPAGARACATDPRWDDRYNHRRGCEIAAHLRAWHKRPAAFNAMSGPRTAIGRQYANAVVQACRTRGLVPAGVEVAISDRAARRRRVAAGTAAPGRARGTAVDLVLRTPGVEGYVLTEIKCCGSSFDDAVVPVQRAPVALHPLLTPRVQAYFQLLYTLRIWQLARPAKPVRSIALLRVHRDEAGRTRCAFSAPPADWRAEAYDLICRRIEAS
jgi:hypothetical protein